MFRRAPVMAILLAAAPWAAPAAPSFERLQWGFGVGITLASRMVWQLCAKLTVWSMIVAIVGVFARSPQSNPRAIVQP
jgi:hypothetical protein